MSHAPGMTARWDVIDDVRRTKIERAVAQAREDVARANPEIIIAFVNDHFKSFFLDAMPAFCIGLGDEHLVPDAKLASILKIPERRAPGDVDLSRHLLESLLARGFDPAFSGELKFADDLSVPLSYLFPDVANTPAIVPIFTNCVAPPLPSLRRCYDLGAAVGEILADVGDNRRLMILGTGGLSHWVGMPKHGTVNSAFDARMLSLVTEHRLDEIMAMTDREVEDEAGNGAFEIRNWLAALGAIGGYRATTLDYVAVPEWLTGIAFVRTDPSAVMAGVST